MSTDGLEQDLSRTFPESKATVRQPKSTSNAGASLTSAQLAARMAVLQLTQSGAMSKDASAILQLLLNQNDALQQRVASLEKLRPA